MLGSVAWIPWVVHSLFAKEISSNFNEMDRGDARITNIFASSVGPASILIWETQNPPIRILNLPWEREKKTAFVRARQTRPGVGALSGSILPPPPPSFAPRSFFPQLQSATTTFPTRERMKKWRRLKVGRPSFFLFSFRSFHEGERGKKRDSLAVSQGSHHSSQAWVCYPLMVAKMLPGDYDHGNKDSKGVAIKKKQIVRLWKGSSQRSSWILLEIEDALDFV